MDYSKDLNKKPLKRLHLTSETTWIKYFFLPINTSQIIESKKMLQIHAENLNNLVNQ